MTSSAAPTRWGWRCRSGQTFEERNLVPQVLCSASWAQRGRRQPMSSAPWTLLSASGAPSSREDTRPSSGFRDWD